MRPDYDGVVYFSDHDRSLEIFYERAKNLVDSFDENREYSDINIILELYNAYRIIRSPGIKKEYSDPYVAKSNKIMKKVAKFFSTITNDNIMNIYLGISYNYVDSFWFLMNNLKVYECISENVFQDILENQDTNLYTILKQKKIVKYFDKSIANYMRNTIESARILVSKYLEREDQATARIEIPPSLLPSEYELIFQKYIESEHPNVGVLQLIAASQTSVECPISDMLRLSAKQKADILFNNGQLNIMDFSYDVEIDFRDNELVKEYKKTDQFGFKITYDIKWINDNIDYPTLLNNFIYLFEYTDIHFRCKLISFQNQMGIFERFLGTKGKKEYETGIAFHMMDKKTSAEMKLYESLLFGYNIRIEDLIKWFFVDYLKDEFFADGFSINIPSSNSTPLEKSRSLLSEMDGILKQYTLYTKYHKIDRSLLEISSNPVIFSELPSLIESKYAYLNSDDLKKEMHLLFSDQCMLNYIHEKQLSEKNFFDLVRKYKIHISDYPEWAQGDIQWLQGRGDITIDKQGFIRLRKSRVILLKDLNDNEVICTSYWNKDIIEQLISSGDIRYGSSLFSEPEQKYFNYMLNKSEFSNGLDLRNKYIHGSNTLDEQQHEMDYLIILKLMIIVIIKINEEFCLAFPMQRDKKYLDEEQSNHS